MARARLGGNATVLNAGPVTRQIGTLPQQADISYGAVSPDGRYVPFVH